jgi:UDPglucose 6-dehydrogenase
MNSTDCVSVFGLGKVGITLSAALVGAGFGVVGVDVAEPVVRSLRDGSFCTDEAGVMERLGAARVGQFRATTDAAEAVAASAVSFIIVPTPSNSLGGFSNRYVFGVLEAIGAATARKQTRHVAAVVSTVLPGSSAAQFIPALERAAQRRIGDRLGYCYNPSFIAQGEVLKGLVQPEYILIGEADAASGTAVEAVHRRIVINDAPVTKMSPIEAEIAKIACNTHETMRVAFANMLLALCNEVPDADVDRITQALTYRIGERFFKGAAPYGGPCWPRDNRALAAFMDLVGVPSTLPNAVDRANADHGLYILRQVLDAVPRGGSVGLLGLAYKPRTSMIDRSFGVDLAGWLSAEGRVVVGWDPLANAEATRALGTKIRIAAEAEDCLACDVVVIALPLAELREINWCRAAATRVLDCWRVLDADQRQLVGSYVPLGLRREMKSRFGTTPGYRAWFEHLTN